MEVDGDATPCSNASQCSHEMLSMQPGCMHLWCPVSDTATVGGGFGRSLKKIFALAETLPDATLVGQAVNQFIFRSSEFLSDGAATDATGSRRLSGPSDADAAEMQSPRSEMTTPGLMSLPKKTFAKDMELEEIQHRSMAEESWRRAKRWMTAALRWPKLEMAPS
ncbi:unnamed protein product [Symbiodinium natans]|uniref:Uncharacterized protein n=1 Tax=Symbiodinium natans TaxID=878477 RepID=A0A812R920_9DINO|nr:unnamed protein product [Symbiodinium natans]